MEFLVCGIATQTNLGPRQPHTTPTLGSKLLVAGLKSLIMRQRSCSATWGQIREQHVWTNTGHSRDHSKFIELSQNQVTHTKKPKMYSRSLWHIRSPSKTHAVVSWRSRLKLHEVKDKHANKTCEASGTRRHTKGFEILLLRMVST